MMTSSSNETLERIARRVPIPDPAYERLLRRRDRKRRNQRIAAGVVGIAVFVAAVGIVTTFGSSDRTQPGASGGAGTGPTATGPMVTGPVIANTRDPSSVGFDGLPPEGATPSKPLRGELVMKEGTSNALAPWYWVNVYADGRLIWSDPTAPRWIEQRLTPEGVELLRSGAVPLGGQFDNPAQGLPSSAWEDRRLRPFVPWRYHACLTGDPPSLAPDFLPAEAKDVLRRTPWTDATAWSQPCREVTVEDTRVLVEILSDAGFEIVEEQGVVGVGGFGAYWYGNQPPKPNPPGIEFWIVLPHGSSDYGYAF
jgi:hypothetical protein